MIVSNLKLDTRVENNDVILKRISLGYIQWLAQGPPNGLNIH